MKICLNVAVFYVIQVDDIFTFYSPTHEVRIVLRMGKVFNDSEGS